jgi:hypothetical protein
MEEKGKNNGEWKNRQKEKQRNLSTAPEAHFSAVKIPFPLTVLLRCIQSDGDPLGIPTLT